jgi:molybdate transport system substrate-binding protein
MNRVVDAGRNCWGLSLLLLALGCSQQAAKEPVMERPKLAIAAASDLQFVLPTLAQFFRQDVPNVEVTLNYGSSGSLLAQIEQGAPFDLYLSADRAYPQKLLEGGHGAAGAEVVTYAIGRLVLWVPISCKVAADVLPRDVIQDSALERIAIANPKHAPYGRAGINALTAWGLKDAIESKLIYAENVAQATQFALTDAADAAFVGKSQALSTQLQAAGRYYEIPLTESGPLEQGLLVLKQAKDPELAKRFAQFLRSEQTKPQWVKHGYDVPQ